VGQKFNLVWNLKSRLRVSLFHDVLEKYRPLRADVMAASPCAPEGGRYSRNSLRRSIRNRERRLRDFLPNSKGNFSYITKNKSVQITGAISGDVKINNGPCDVWCCISDASAAIVLFEPNKLFVGEGYGADRIYKTKNRPPANREGGVRIWK
jgi:hypothetical protein